MEFFDKLTKKATETYKGAAEKTGKIAREAKLKMKISENKNKINDLYKEIGKKIYQKHILNEKIVIKDDLKEEFKKINELSNEIETWHEEIRTLSNIKLCVNCKEELEREAKFCSKCGAEQPEIKDEPAVEVEILEEDKNNNETKEDEENKENEKKDKE